MENLGEAVAYAHIMGVKVLLAINILFSNDEMQSALDIVVKAYNLGVDAFIVQDLGLISLIYKNYPQIEIHASTQMGLHNLEGVKEVAKYGVKRVVLARETPLEEIKRIKNNIDIEIEYFAHGALCVSFSGNCYLSSYLFNASGNRGRCKQLCRLPYTFYDGERQLKKGYLLSAKDYNMLTRLSELEEAGVDVIKIEGRARRPYYVATATKAYRRTLDGLSVDKSELELAFNRTFTEGYFNGNGDIISLLQNHIGLKVGRVESVKNGKNFNEIYISSSLALSPKSTFKIIENGVEKNTITAYDLTLQQNGFYKITTTQKVAVGGEVRLIVDAEKEEQAKKLVKKRKIKLLLSLTVGEPITATVEVDGERITVSGDLCEPALKQPITQEDLKINFNKSELFEAQLEIKRLDGVFMPKTKLNEFRRKVLDTVYSFIVDKYKKSAQTIVIDKASELTSLEYGVMEKRGDITLANLVIYSPEQYELNDICKAKAECEGLGKSFYLDTPNFALERDINLLRSIIEKTGVKIVANNYYALSFNAPKIIGYGLNVYNGYTAKELSAPYILAENDKSFSAPFMTLRHCPIKAHIGGDCKNCKYHGNYSYKMDGGRILKLKRKKLSSCTFYLV